jgi:hypothetical protein
MFQSSPKISWQGHLGGAITGFVFAIYYRNRGLSIANENEELEEEISDDDPYWQIDNSQEEEEEEEEEENKE